MLSQYFWIAGSMIFFLLGYVHLSYNFSSSKYYSHYKVEKANIPGTYSPFGARIFCHNTWKGFTLTHSISAIYFGLLNMILAGGYFKVLKDSFVILSVIIGISLIYFFLALFYWLSLPRFTMLIASGFLIASAMLMIINK